MLRLIGLMTFVIALVACGGGSSGNGGGGSSSADNETTPTDADQAFSLSTFSRSETGTIYSTNLTGHDSYGHSFSGSLSLANRERVMMDGVLVTPRDLLLSVSDGVSTMTITGTSNLDQDGNLISYVLQTTGVTCVASTPDRLPDVVKIGDFGFLSTLICDDDTLQERSWRIADSGNSTAEVIVANTVKDEWSTVLSYGETGYVIDGAGAIQSLRQETTLPADNYTLSLRST